MCVYRNECASTKGWPWKRGLRTFFAATGKMSHSGLTLQSFVRGGIESGTPG
jgi:hypothetical protein